MKRGRGANPNSENDKWNERFQRSDISEGSSVTGLFYRITCCYCTLAFDWANHRLALPISSLIGPKQDGEIGINSLIRPAPYGEMILSTIELSALDTIGFVPKVSYPAADKHESYSSRMINDVRAQLHIQYTAPEWNCWIQLLHLNPRCQTELFLIAFDWQQFSRFHNTISMLLAWQSATLPLQIAFSRWHFSHRASGGKHIQVERLRNSMTETSVGKYEAGREGRDVQRGNRRRRHSFSPSYRQVSVAGGDYWFYAVIGRCVWLLWRLQPTENPLSRPDRLPVSSWLHWSLCVSSVVYLSAVFRVVMIRLPSLLFL